MDVRTNNVPEINLLNIASDEMMIMAMNWIFFVFFLLLLFFNQSIHIELENFNCFGRREMFTKISLFKYTDNFTTKK